MKKPGQPRCKLRDYQRWSQQREGEGVMGMDSYPPPPEGMLNDLFWPIIISLSLAFSPLIILVAGLYLSLLFT